MYNAFLHHVSDSTPPPSISLSLPLSLSPSQNKEPEGDSADLPQPITDGLDSLTADTLQVQ